MRFASLLAITLMCATSALGQSAPASSAATTTKTSSADVPPMHQITREQVHEIMELTHTNQVAHQAMRQSMAAMREAFPPYMPADVIVELEQTLMKIDFEPMAVTAYQKHISMQDAAQIIAFYKTPAGQHLLAAMPEITREMKLTAAQEGSRIAQQVIEQHMDEIKAARKQYMQDHTGQPKVITPN